MLHKQYVDFDKISVHTGPEESPGYLMWRVSTQWRGSIESALKTIGLTHPQFVVLAATGWLTSKHGPITQIEISKMVGLDPNTISQIIRGLESKKLIKRTRASDERGKNPALTSEGASRLQVALPMVEQADKKFFAVLDCKEMESLLKIFQKLMMS